jgi:battenin
MIVAYFLISISAYFESENIIFFVICLLASVIHGLTSCFGESVILGYLKGFPADLVVGWSSGTGFAGVIGAGLVVVLFAFKFPLFAVLFLSLSTRSTSQR